MGREISSPNFKDNAWGLQTLFGGSQILQIQRVPFLRAGTLLESFGTTVHGSHQSRVEREFVKSLCTL